MSKSSRNRGPAWSCRRTAAIRPGMPGRPQGLVRHRPRVEPLEGEHVPRGDRLDDQRRDARLGRGERVVQLVGPVHGQHFRPGPGDPDEIRRPVDDDPPVRVRQPGRDPLRDGVMSRPVGNGRDDLVDRGWHAERVAQPLRFDGGHTRAVIIGGGVGGTSIAYHLAERGWTDIVLVDRAELTSGSTFHSAGLVGQLRGSVTLTKMMMYGVRPVPAAGRRDRHRPVVARGRLAPSGVQPGAVRGAPPPGRLGQDVRPAARADHGDGRPRTASR